MEGEVRRTWYQLCSVYFSRGTGYQLFPVVDFRGTLPTKQVGEKGHLAGGPRLAQPGSAEITCDRRELGREGDME